MSKNRGVMRKRVRQLERTNHNMYIMLLTAHREVTKLTGQNGMHPNHEEWIQDLFMEVEMYNMEY